MDLCELINLGFSTFGFGTEPVLTCETAPPSSVAQSGSSADNHYSTAPAHPLDPDVQACMMPVNPLFSEEPPDMCVDDSDSSSDGSGGVAMAMAGGVVFLLTGEFVDPTADGEFLSARGQSEVAQARDIVREAQRILSQEYGVSVDPYELRETYHYEVAPEYKEGSGGRRNYGSLEAYDAQVSSLVSEFTHRAVCVDPMLLIPIEGVVDNFLIQAEVNLIAVSDEAQRGFQTLQRERLTREINALLTEHNVDTYADLPRHVVVEFEEGWRDRLRDFIKSYDYNKSPAENIDALRESAVDAAEPRTRIVLTGWEELPIERSIPHDHLRGILGAEGLEGLYRDSLFRNNVRTLGDLREWLGSDAAPVIDAVMERNPGRPLTELTDHIIAEAVLHQAERSHDRLIPYDRRGDLLRRMTREIVRARTESSRGMGERGERSDVEERREAEERRERERRRMERDRASRVR